jgi:hypothetical protein
MTRFRIPRFIRAVLAVIAIATTLGTSTASADIVARRDGSKAVDVPAVAVPSSDSGDGFDLGDVAVGAGAVLALVAATGGAVLLRGQQRIRHAPS